MSFIWDRYQILFNRDMPNSTFVSDVRLESGQVDLHNRNKIDFARIYGGG